MSAFQEYLEKSKDKNIAEAVSYSLQMQLELMQSQIGYVKSLTSETITTWSGGNQTERNRLEWITETEAEIAKCQAHITAMNNVK